MKNGNHIKRKRHRKRLKGRDVGLDMVSSQIAPAILADRYIVKKKGRKHRKRLEGHGVGLGMVASQIAPIILAELFK